MHAQVHPPVHARTLMLQQALTICTNNHFPISIAYIASDNGNSKMEKYIHKSVPLLPVTFCNIYTGLD